MEPTSEVHYHQESSSSSMSWMIGLLVLAVLVFLMFYYGLPAIRSASSPQINVPDKVDVNVNQPK